MTPANNYFGMRHDVLHHDIGINIVSQYHRAPLGSPKPL